jgi:hypothetical protein
MHNTPVLVNARMKVGVGVYFVGLLYGPNFGMDEPAFGSL